MEIIYSENIYDSDKRKFQKGCLLIDQGIIKDILPVLPEAMALEGVEVIDLGNFYVVPGLINTHCHLEFSGSPDPLPDYLQTSNDEKLRLALENAETMLASGVTVARDAGSSWKALALKALDEKAREGIPTLIFTGPPLTVTNGHLNFMGGTADTPAELLEAVNEHYQAPVGAIKIVVDGGQLTPGSMPEKSTYGEGLIRTVCREAQQYGLPTLAHVLTCQGFKNSLNGGVNSLDHCAFFEREEHGWLKRCFPADETLFYPAKEREVFFGKGLSAAMHTLDAARRDPDRATEKEKFLLVQEELMLENFMKLIDRGLLPVVMTDAGIANTPFDETYMELVMMKRAGMQEPDIIHAASIYSAGALGLEKQVGQIKKGFYADIIALADNPLKDIGSYGDAVYVHPSRVGLV